MFLKKVIQHVTKGNNPLVLEILNIMFQFFCTKIFSTTWIEIFVMLLNVIERPRNSDLLSVNSSPLTFVVAIINEKFVRELDKVHETIWLTFRQSSREF